MAFCERWAIFSWKRANRSLPLFCKERITPIALYKERQSDERQKRFAIGNKKKGKGSEKLSKTLKKNWTFSIELLVFERDSLESRANHLCCSFLQSESLTVTLLLKATRVIRLWLLFLKSDESKSVTVAIFSKRAKSERAKEQTPNPDF